MYNFKCLQQVTYFDALRSWAENHYYNTQIFLGMTNPMLTFSHLLKTQRSTVWSEIRED